MNNNEYNIFDEHKARNTCVAWSAILILLAHPVGVSAAVVADSNGQVQHTPIVEMAPNGVTIVQITNPSAGGVSRNLYQQFSVDPKGVILNNSQQIGLTQLAGLLQGNSNLKNGSAHIILNEVTSSNPSFLRGYTEVAGQRAEVIIANPNGISGDGFGFINTSRAVLTTGLPTFGGNGSLDSFRVSGGKITIQGAGMDAKTVDQVDLISRTMEINAKIMAGNVNGIAGSNTVEYKTLGITKNSDDTMKSQVAIDIGMLGGMYADKIYLVGTEQGVGVNSKGTLAASGDIKITSDGKITFAKNNTTAGTNIELTGKDGVALEGAQLSAGKDINLKGKDIALMGTTERKVDERGNPSGDNYQHKKADNEIVSGSSLAATQNITLSSTGNVTVAASNLTAKVGNITIAADTDVTFKEMSERHEILEESSNVDKKIFGNTTTQNSTHTIINAVKGSTISGEVVTVSAGNDLTVKNSKVVSGGDLALTANRDIVITTAQETREFEQKDDYTAGFAHNVGKHDHVIAQKTEDQGSVVGSNQGGVSITAGNTASINGSDIVSDMGTVVKGQDIIARGDNISSKKGGIILDATHNVNLGTLRRSREIIDESHANSEGVISHKVTENQINTAKNALTGSTIVGDTVAVSAANNITIQGSAVMGTHDVTMIAKENLRIMTGQQTTESEKNNHQLKAGLGLNFGKGGLDLFAGVSNQKDQEKQQSVDQVRSNIISNQGQVIAVAGKDVQVIGSGIMSSTGTAITGQNISIEASSNTTNSQKVNDSKELGLHISAGNKVINSVGDSVSTAVDYFKKGQEATDTQTKIIYDTRGGSAVVDAVKAVKKVQDIVNDLNVGISLSGGIQNTKKTSEVTRAQGSQLVSDGEIQLITKGSGGQYDNTTMLDGDISITGSSVTGKKIVIDAAKDVTLRAAMNTNQSNSHTIGGAGEVGVKLGFSNNSVGVNVGVGASLNGGMGSDHSGDYTQTTLKAGDQLTIQSGGDITLVGAKAQGEKVQVTAARNLLIESQQGTETHISGDASIGGKVAVDAITGIVNGSVSGKVSGLASDYKSVTEQSGIVAGKEGVDIFVGENTNLKGGIIKSAGKDENNKLSTNTLTVTGVDNQARSIAGGVGGTVVAGMTTVTSFAPDIDIPGFGSKKNTTQSGITGGSLEVRSASVDLTKVSRIPDETHKTLDKTMDENQMKEQKKVIKEVGEQVIDLVKDLLHKPEDKKVSSEPAPSEKVQVKE